MGRLLTFAHTGRRVGPTYDLSRITAATHELSANLHEKRTHRDFADAHSASLVHFRHRCDAPPRRIGVALADWLVSKHRWHRPCVVPRAFNRVGGIPYTSS